MSWKLGGASAISRRFRFVKPAKEEQTWVLNGAHSTEAACESAAEQKITTLSTRGGATVNVHGNIVTRVTRLAGNNDTVSTTDRVLCLPDTVDPRGPKGVR